MRNANKLLLWMIFLSLLVTRIDAQLHIPFVDSIRYVACKPGEMSIGFDGYASYLEIFLSWAFQWGIMGLLYKFNTGNWPPRPFQNSTPKEKPVDSSSTEKLTRQVATEESEDEFEPTAPGEENWRKC